MAHLSIMAHKHHVTNSAFVATSACQQCMHILTMAMCFLLQLQHDTIKDCQLMQPAVYTRSHLCADAMHAHTGYMLCRGLVYTVFGLIYNTWYADRCAL